MDRNSEERNVIEFKKPRTKEDEEKAMSLASKI